MKPGSPEKRLLLVELNEFSVELFRRGARELDLPNVLRLLSMPASATTTDDRVEHHGLDPWVQWVSVHTGEPSPTHGVMHLGDTPTKLGSRQIWEVLSAHGVSSGVWGAMNATRGTATLCRFFLPDPWTFSEPAYPAAINQLLALPRYYSRNYLDVSRWQFAKGAGQLLVYALRSGAVLQLLKLVPLILGGIVRNGINNAVLFSLFDLFSTVLFLARRKHEAPQFSLVFLNSIAHLQHHRWRYGERLGSDLQFGLAAIDRILGLLFASLEEGEALIVMNALAQKNVSEEEPLMGYRQISPGEFLRSVGLQHLRVEQLMTNDGHVFFGTVAERDGAVRVLDAARIGGKALFQVEGDVDDPCRLFYQVVLWDVQPPGALLHVNEGTIPFFKHFEALGLRTGAHVPEGQAFAAGIKLPERALNHDLWQYICRYFGVNAGA